jgi:hypothetical protein
MAMIMNRFVLPLMMAVLVLLVVLGSARRIEDKNWSGGELPATSGHHSIVQFAKHLYLQRLQAGAHTSCGSYDPGNPQCPPHQH